MIRFEKTGSLNPAGKAIVASLVSSLERAEMWQTFPLTEEVPFLEAAGHISREAAVMMLRREVDMNLYYTLIGRRVNTRENDQSSILNSRDPEEYFRRIKSKEEGECWRTCRHPSRFSHLHP